MERDLFLMNEWQKLVVGSLPMLQPSRSGWVEKKLGHDHKWLETMTKLTSFARTYDFLA